MSALRRRLRLVAGWRGLCWTGAALLGGLALAVFFDLFSYLNLRVDMPPLARALFLILTVVALAGMAIGAREWNGAEMRALLETLLPALH